MYVTLKLEERGRGKKEKNEEAGGGGILCLLVSSNTRISLKKSVNAPVKILCRLRLLQLEVKAELQI